MSSDQASPLHNLPVEVLFAIMIDLSHLDLSRLRHTCRYLRSMGYDWPFWSEKAWHDFEFPRSLFVETKHHDPLDRYREIFDHYYIPRLGLSPSLGLLKLVDRLAGHADPDRPSLHLETSERSERSERLERSERSERSERPKVSPDVETSESREVSPEVDSLDNYGLRYEIPHVPFHLNEAVKNGKLDIITAIINHGVTGAALNKALYMAAVYNQLDIVKLLISHGATDLQSALIAAAHTDHNDIVAFIVAYQGDHALTPMTAQCMLTVVSNCKSANLTHFRHYRGCMLRYQPETELIDLAGARLVDEN
jgi:hypothetical protein